jgi:hypothetical protein
VLVSGGERAKPTAGVDPKAGSMSLDWRDRTGLWIELLRLSQCILWIIQNALLSSYLHVVARTLGARQLAESSARAAILALGCVLLSLFTLLLGLVAPIVVALWILLTAVLSLASFFWQAILLAWAYRALAWHLDS